MYFWRGFVLSLVAGMISSAAPVHAQSKYPMPSAAPKIGVDVTGRAEGIEDKVETTFANIDMAGSYRTQERIKNRLGEYLKKIGAVPTSGQVHVFYVQATMNAQGRIIGLKDFQYLTHGKTTIDAIRESFTLDGAPGVQARMYNLKTGTSLAGIYVSAHPNGDGFIIRGGSLTPAFYQKIREEGLAIRDTRQKERAETKRIEEKRQQLVTAHAATDDEARRRLERDLNRPPLPPGPALSSAEDLGAPSVIYLPPTRVDSAPVMSVSPTTSAPTAHPPVSFDQSPAPSQSSPPVDIPIK